MTIQNKGTGIELDNNMMISTFPWCIRNMEQMEVSAWFINIGRLSLCCWFITNFHLLSISSTCCQRRQALHPLYSWLWAPWFCSMLWTMARWVSQFSLYNQVFCINYFIPHSISSISDQYVFFFPIITIVPHASERKKYCCFGNLGILLAASCCISKKSKGWDEFYGCFISLKITYDLLIRIQFLSTWSFSLAVHHRNHKYHW